MTITTSEAKAKQAKHSQQGEAELIESMKQLKAMASFLNDTGFMLTALLLMNEGSTKVTTEQLKYFTGPVIFGKPDSHGSGWGLPQEIIERLVKAARLDKFCLILDEVSGIAKPGQTCTPVELLCAIQPYTMTAPLTTNLAAICTNAFADAIETHPGLFPGVDIGQFRTSVSDEYERRDLQLTIRRKVVARGRNPLAKLASPDQDGAEGQTQAEAQPEPQSIQMKLF